MIVLVIADIVPDRVFRTLISPEDVATFLADTDLLLAMDSHESNPVQATPPQ